MFYYFSHTMQAIILPPGLIIFLFILGLCCLRRWRRVAMAFIATALTTLWLLSTPIIAQYLIDRLQTQYPLVSITPHPNAAALIVLGGGAHKALEYNQAYRISNSTRNRLRYAVHLHDAMHIPIIVSGGQLEKGRLITEASVMQEALYEDHALSILDKEDKSITTLDEAKFITPLLAKHGIQTIYLVTNAWHMPRAMQAFQAYLHPQAITVIAAPMGYISLLKQETLLNYLPLMDALDASTQALHEWVGILVYRLFTRGVGTMPTHSTVVVNHLLPLQC